MLTRELEETLSLAVDEAVKHRHEYVTLEHLLFALLDDKTARDVLFNCGANVEQIAKLLEEYFSSVLEKIPASIQQMPELTSTFQATIQYAILQAEGSGQKRIDGQLPGGTIVGTNARKDRIAVNNYTAVCHGKNQGDG